MSRRKPLSPAPADPVQENQRRLSEALATVRGLLERYVQAEGGDANQSRPGSANRPPEDAPALARVCDIFRLSPFERDLLLLCAGMELDSRFAPLCALAQGDPGRAYPTFSLALSALPDAHWSALTPSAPLRYWRLVEVGAGQTLATSPLRVDECILHALAGTPILDERLVGWIDPMETAETPAPSQAIIVQRIVQAWKQAQDSTQLPVIALCGSESVGKRAIAASVCSTLGLNLYRLSANALPTGISELEALIRLWERTAGLNPSALLLDADDWDSAEPTRAYAVNRLLERTRSPLFAALFERRPLRQRPMLAFDVEKPMPCEQRELWQRVLSDQADDLSQSLDELAAQFSLDTFAIQNIGQETRLAEKTVATRSVPRPAGRLAEGHRDWGSPLASALWEACRAQARPRLEGLAQRIETKATWNDLILPEAQKQTLREIGAQVRQRMRVYEEWGFGGKSARGLGISALFAGASGTGKTMAAEVLAADLQLDLYRIDLSSVVSKYIGETEKNLRKVFDAATESGAILLFDEADALFGKRSEVKDSHDRYANIEVSYLLQRMETYRGLAILTTNMQDALDTAFVRRLRFIVQFAFPDTRMRTEIWRGIFPKATPTEGLDHEALARLNVAGGNIRNIALNAAFVAAAAGEVVQMRHLLHAARGEYVKLEKTLTDSEIGGWVT